MNRHGPRWPRWSAFLPAFLTLILVRGAWAQLRPGDILFSEPNELFSSVQGISPAGVRSGFIAQVPGVLLDLEAGPRGEIYASYDGASRGDDAIVRIDPVTGALTTVVSAPDEIGSPFRGLAIEGGGTLLAEKAGQLLRIDPATGASTVVSGTLGRSDDLEVGPGGRIYALVGINVGKIIEVDPVTGAQRVVSTDSRFGNASGLALSPEGQLYVPVIAEGQPGTVLGIQQVLRIDPLTGAATTVYEQQRTLEDLSDVRDLVVETAGTLLGADQGAATGRGPGDGRILRYDPVSGERSILFQDVEGDDRLMNPQRLAVFVPEPGASLVSILMAGFLLFRRHSTE